MTYSEAEVHSETRAKAFVRGGIIKTRERWGEGWADRRVTKVSVLKYGNNLLLSLNRGFVHCFCLGTRMVKEMKGLGRPRWERR